MIDLRDDFWWELLEDEDVGKIHERGFSYAQENGYNEFLASSYAMGYVRGIIKSICGIVHEGGISKELGMKITGLSEPIFDICMQYLYPDDPLEHLS